MAAAVFASYRNAAKTKETARANGRQTKAAAKSK